VNFVVAGFHQIFAYVPGVKPEDVAFATPANPLPPPPPPPPTGPVPVLFTNFQNRVESVVFPEPGRYLVICNVNPHFREGMYAWVKVSK
jgi:hypothetical protein